MFNDNNNFQIKNDSPPVLVWNLILLLCPKFQSVYGDNDWSQISMCRLMLSVRWIIIALTFTHPFKLDGGDRAIVWDEMNEKNSIIMEQYRLKAFPMKWKRTVACAMYVKRKSSLWKLHRGKAHANNFDEQFSRAFETNNFHFFFFFNLQKSRASQQMWKIFHGVHCIVCCNRTNKHLPLIAAKNYRWVQMILSCAWSWFIVLTIVNK